MQNFDENGQFLYDKYHYPKARESAASCPHFTVDADDDELVDSELQSCFNCLFRRWQKESFTCFKLK
ncbi:MULTISPECIES: molybdopterin biosynthesis protein MoeB [Glaesserella]|uniref:Molybdopterin biosynthesis protein MoeB n=1 Tax=Glaesserella australis TaxID=2094024 RepID=A0A328BXA8_9PAST|nr:MULTISPECIES: molybdopterin biosynthesis protein MoeB [Glaesserella]AUI65995.1 molybdopterin biosynthesis protein MoeB [Glaesserella sp. 15-184]RAL18285.1 molybdopterin biosynthesis protein MoeB [Glaesserella australis]